MKIGHTILDLQFTPNQWAALQHRLDVPDAIVESLEDDYAAEDVLDVVELLTRRLFVNAENLSAGLTRDVLIECVEGSTWVGVHSNDPRAQDRAYRTLKAIAAKLTAHYHRDVRVPRA